MSIPIVDETPGEFILNSTADNPDPDGSFNLTWTVSLRSTSYSIYSLNSTITAINSSLIEIVVGTTNNSYKIVGLGTGLYFFVVVAQNSYGTKTSNCLNITVDISSNSKEKEDDDDKDDKGQDADIWEELLSNLVELTSNPIASFFIGLGAGIGAGAGLFALKSRAKSATSRNREKLDQLVEGIKKNQKYRKKQD